MNSADTVNLSELANVDLSDPNSLKLVNRFIANIDFIDILKFSAEIVIVVGLCSLLLLLTDKVAKKLTSALQKQQCDMLLVRFMPLITKCLKIIILLVLVLTWAGLHGINLTSIMAGIGIGGLAVGFAAKETIADIFGMVILIADKTVKIGDIVELEQTIGGETVVGTVEDINFRSAKIRSFDGALNTIPNHILASIAIKNLSSVSKRRITEYVDIVYETNDEKINEALALCKKIINEHEKTKNTSYAGIATLTSSSIRLVLRIDLMPVELTEIEIIRTEIIMRILKEFNNANIEFAYDTQTLYLRKEL